MASQQVDALASRWEISADAVYSVYPEQGHASHNSLPHIVFNDPRLPWESIGSRKGEQYLPKDADQNRVPWLACLVFSPDELTIPKAEMEAIFEPTSIKSKAKQTESLAIRLPVGDLPELGKGSTWVPSLEIDSTERGLETGVILPTVALFNGLFGFYDEEGKGPLPSPMGGPDISRYRFLAHLMRMNTTGMAHADRSDDQFSRDFSVLVANRVGPLEGNQASPMIAHIVALEGLESFKRFPLAMSKDISALPARVALVSLYSWSFTYMPPNSLSVKATFQNLADNSAMLKPIISQDKKDNSDPAVKPMFQRLENGYTIIQYRTPTGEQTAALARGPLTPNRVPYLGQNWFSNSGSNLQILDPELGMMDLTFSTAWSLGRNLALADQAFTMSLMRVRRQIMKSATAEARREMFHATRKSHYSRIDLAQETEKLVDGAVTASRNLDNEFNESSSPDWMIVLRFILDLYNLVKIPAHYLLLDQSFLPQEILRFFFIDHNWIDALVDGALSLGNHVGTDQNDGPDPDPKPGQAHDPARRSIKKAFNRFLNEPSCLGDCTAIPRFGFFMRSEVVSQFPDLKVNAHPKSTQKTPFAPMLLRHEIIDKGTMLGFFSDELLKDGGLQELRFELPGYQQYFAIDELSTFQIKIQYRRPYTGDHDKDSNQNEAVAEICWRRNERGAQTSEPDVKVRPPIFVWGLTRESNDLRLLLVERLADDVYETIYKEMAKTHPRSFTETKPTSAMMGFQLLSSSWQLNLGNMPALAAAATPLSLVSAALSYPGSPVPVASGTI
ncbi:hypothetical protein N7520_011779 [Penicillium odoratum]|uniref:uncharacterized protein n=1 Tax=Penicillium odoratum TaxID=1167516 RepID=UPI0025478F06|nr:uncharacterized protein N7520_011779 [Penicillium odoratum]KAJ5746597.1 hypothetical protein N7520_011779 [Penicillium odoratum]